MDELPPRVEMIRTHRPFSQQIAVLVQRDQRVPVGGGGQWRQEIDGLVLADGGHPIRQGHDAFLGVEGQADDGHGHHRKASVIEVMQVLMHLAGFLPFVHCYEVLGVIRFHTHVEHLDVGFKHGVGQLWVLADLGPDLADHIHVVGVALPALQPL